MRDIIDQANGISLYLQGTQLFYHCLCIRCRYIPVPTGNSSVCVCVFKSMPVYPCTYRELSQCVVMDSLERGISLYLQGTHTFLSLSGWSPRYIPVPTGNSCAPIPFWQDSRGISLYLQGTPTSTRNIFLGPRYIPVPTGNSFSLTSRIIFNAVYPCTYRELRVTNHSN